MIHGLEKLRGGSDFPTIGQQLVNAAGAAARAMASVMHGSPLIVPIGVELQRQMICADCDENKSGRCRVCGCGVSAQFIRKTHLATEKCPLPVPKWGRWTPQNKTKEN
jgi:hypothetical protein